MRFKEMTSRFGAEVKNPGGRGDGLPLNVAIPSISSMRIWQAVHGGYSWVIAFEPGLPYWTEEQKAQHIGYTASYRRADHRNSNQTIRVGGGPWDSFTEAEEACSRTWKQIRNAT
jgi:hypothetical protein